MILKPVVDHRRLGKGGVRASRVPLRSRQGGGPAVGGCPDPHRGAERGWARGPGEGCTPLAQGRRGAADHGAAPSPCLSHCVSNSFIGTHWFFAPCFARLRCVHPHHLQSSLCAACLDSVAEFFTKCHKSTVLCVSQHRFLGAYLSPRDCTQLFLKSVTAEDIRNEHGIPFQVRRAAPTQLPRCPLTLAQLHCNEAFCMSLQTRPVCTISVLAKI